MGSTCCCMRVENFENYMNWNGFLYRDCTCVNCFLQNFLHVYGSLFGREVARIPSSIQGATALTTTTSSTDSSFSDVYRSPPRPLPYDADPRYLRLQRDGLVSRWEKGSSHSHEESEPLRRSDIEADSESLITGEKWSACEDGLREPHKSTVILSSRKSGNDIASVCSLSKDEDVCPTCLEDYTPENPKIMTKCSHHFHLGCIYEWMERSENCPVCGKVMDFKESP